VKRRIQTIPVVLVATLLGCNGSPSAPGAQASGAGPRVLFIGNSLTDTNNLPAMVEALAAARGDALTTRTVAFGGFSLGDHWGQGEARRAIAQGGWTHVVLQQGPSSLPESQALLREYTRRFDAEARRIGARTVLYMVWPSLQRFSDFDGVSRSYAAAAQDVGGILIPAGEAWRAAWRRDPAVPLYGSDNFHPSALGTYLAALVTCQQITGRSPTGLPAVLRSPSGAFPTVTTTEALARLLQDAAVEANASFGRH
jgi:hypothetical protein